MPARIARHLVVHGHVQGVYFRAFVRETAARSGVAGWAVNQDDGSVAVHLEGEPGAVARVERACRNGPRGAHVDRVEAVDARVEGLDGFGLG